MVASRPCPRAEEFKKLTAKAGETWDIEQLAQHLENCAHCSGVVEELLVKDLLSVALLSPDVPRPRQEEKTLDQLKEQLRNLATRTEAAPAVGPVLAPPQAADEIGRLGPYRVLRILGQGGMGVVYQAEDPQLKRLLAVKAMLPSAAAHPSGRQRFLREAQAAAAIVHDHVIPIYKVGEDRGIPFLAMPFLQGENLREHLERVGILPPAEVLRIGREIAEGLAAAHQQGLIHRDIKPANIWLESPVAQEPSAQEPSAFGQTTIDYTLQPRGGGRVKILDFGLARAVEEDAHLTQTGVFVGTPAFMAPFQGTVKSVLVAVLMHRPAPPRELNPELPTALSDFIMHLLAKDPADRPQNARQVVAALEAIATRPPEPRFPLANEY